MRARDLVADWLIDRVAAVLQIDPGRIAYDEVFVELGLSSVQAIELSDDLARWTDLTLPPTLVFDFPTVEAAATYVAAEAERQGRRLAPETMRAEARP